MEMHLYAYGLRLANGDDAGTIATNRAFRVGDTVIAHGNRRYRVTCCRAGPPSSIDGPARGILEVEPDRM
jgi:hypothetical protein